ncbi:MAG TPA: polysaccharide biosynthesis/export family protein [Pirellulales bacterium]|nr:polysaccharide biosynthesis/export family protein [Pirellulales bacterium]
MTTLRRQQAFSAMAALLVSFAALAGCSGNNVLFPTRDHLMKTTEFVRRGIPRQSAIPRELEKTVIPDYILQPGDVLVIEPTRLDSPIRLPADQTILPDGTVDLGRYGRLIVAGKTVEQVEDEVLAAVRLEEPAPDGSINVRLVNPQSAVYYVLGEVESPGSFPFIGRETVLDAIMAAGGLGDKASQCNIILSRPTLPAGCRIVLPVCYRQIVQLGDTTTNYQLMPGDRVYVATRGFGEGLWCKKSCPLCKGLQCPCPPNSALVPALPAITPPNVIHEGAMMPGSPEPLPAVRSSPNDMPLAPGVDDEDSAEPFSD